MVGLGWYLDVFLSESHVLVWDFDDFFFDKNRKKKENGNLGKTGPLAASMGCLAVARPRTKMPTPPPQVLQGVANYAEAKCYTAVKSLFTVGSFRIFVFEYLVFVPR